MYFASYVVWPIKGDMKIDEPFEALADLQDQEEKRALAGSDDSSLSSDGKRKEELYDLS